jgi:hypothetical protein
VPVVRTFPGTIHMFLSDSMDVMIKVREVGDDLG